MANPPSVATLMQDRAATLRQPPTGMPGGPGMAGPRPAGNGAVFKSKVFYDQAGRRRTSPVEVPVDQYGQIAGVEFRCPKCHTLRWFPVQVAERGIPVCETDGQRMRRLTVSTSLVPWAAIRTEVEPQLRAVWAVLLAGAAGAGVHDSHVPPVALLAAAIPAGVVAARIVQARQINQAVRDGHLTADDTGRRRRATINRRARAVCYYTVLVFLWLAGAAFTGVDPNTTGGRVAVTALMALWVLPAASWWRLLRRRRTRPPVPVVVGAEPDTEVPMDPDEAQTRRVWETIVAVRKDQIIGVRADGSVIKAGRAGKLVGTRLEDWHTVVGGCAFTVVGPAGDYNGEVFTGARPAIASAFSMRTGMVTAIPDEEDENRALVLLQRTSPIRDVIRWSGPDSIDAVRGTAPIAVYADGEAAIYEIYRPEWGSPHVAAFGTTGSGKSILLNQLFTIDRWASHVGPDGVRRGLVASFLIDPQQGQSFAPFLDDLAGPVASSLAEATVLVEAMTQEMLRRNRWLAREAKTWDPRRKKWRRGRTWWNPLTDGPILTLTIDEAHAYLTDRKFCDLLTGAGRMWRKCGGQVRLATHTPLLNDLGGSMALRDMLTGGLVAVFRTANSLSGAVAFNGRLPVDPRTIPAIPGSCYVLTGLQPKPMLARAMWEPDYYDWIRDEQDQPIGYPAPLPPETLDAFGPDYAAWVQHAANPEAGLFAVPTAQRDTPGPEAPASCVDAVRLVLALGREGTGGAMNMEQLDQALRDRGVTAPSGKPYTTRTIRAALTELRKTGHVETSNGRHTLTPDGVSYVLDGLPAAERLSYAA